MINPLIFEKTKDGEAMYDIFSRLIKDRIIFLYGEMDDDVGAIIPAILKSLDTQSHKPISIYIKSPGGLVHSALFPIYDMMNNIESPIKTVCLGEACSSAATILAAGTKGMRYAMPNSYVMIHDFQGGVGGSATNIVKEAKRIKFWNDRHISILAKHTGKSEKAIAKACKDETFLTADEALKFGIIDKITKISEKANISE